MNAATSSEVVIGRGGLFSRFSPIKLRSERRSSRGKTVRLRCDRCMALTGPDVPNATVGFHTSGTFSSFSLLAQAEMATQPMQMKRARQRFIPLLQLRHYFSGHSPPLLDQKLLPGRCSASGGTPPGEFGSSAVARTPSAAISTAVRGLRGDQGATREPRAPLADQRMFSPRYGRAARASHQPSVPG